MSVKETIYETNDLSIFKRMDANRPLNEVVVKKLMNSMEKEYIPIPILVNEKFEVVDGQHRLEAARRLEIPICYTIQKGANEETCRKLNQDQSGWKQNDFLHYFASLGSEPAKRILDLSAKHSVKARDVICCANKNRHIIDFTARGGGSNVDWFNDETFSAADCKRAEDCIKESFEMIEALGGLKNTRKSTFVSAWIRFYDNENVDNARMKYVLSNSRNDLWKLNLDDMVRKMVSVYNSRKRPPYLDIYHEKDNFKIVSSEVNHWRNVRF